MSSGRPSAPWQARLSGGEVYVQLEGGQRCALMAPVQLECTVGLSASSPAATSAASSAAAADAASLLSLVVHANMPELRLTLGQRQVSLKERSDVLPGV